MTEKPKPDLQHAGERHARKTNPLANLMRATLRQIRIPTVGAANFASRFTAVLRYSFNLVLWSRVFASESPLAQTRKRLAERRIDDPAPVLHIAGHQELAPIWENGFAAVYDRLLLNLQKPNLLSEIRYAHPAPAFQGIYLWDSAFIAQIWKLWDIGVALDVDRAVVAMAEEGRLQHVVAHFVESSFTQPPLIAWSLWRLHQWAGSGRTREVIEAAYPTLVDYNGWLYRHRRFDDGLFYWRHPYESGVENAPRFSSRDEHTLADTTQLAAPDLCSYVVLQNESLAAMAEELDRPDDASRFRSQADALRERVNDRLWHDDDGLYYDRHVGTGEFVRSRTIASLLPLWAGIPDDRRAARLLDAIMNPASFNSNMPLPSVALDDPDFAKDMWRGAVWINTAYGVLLGMQRYGFADQAADMAFRLADAAYRTHANLHHIYEFYDPQRFDIAELHRKKGNRWKHFTLGAKPRPEFVGWSGLVNNLVLEHLMGFTLDRGEIVLKPCMPAQAEGLAMAVRLPAYDLSLEMEVLPGRRVRGVARHPAGVRRFELACNQTVRLSDLPLEEGS